MGTFFKETSETAKQVREVEQYLRDKNISIYSRGDGLIIAVNGCPIVVIGDTSEIQQTFPSDFDGTRLQYVDHYIEGK